MGQTRKLGRAELLRWEARVPGFFRLKEDSDIQTLRKTTVNTKVKDLVDAVSRFVSRGYDHDYRIKDAHLHDVTVDRPIATSDVRVDGALRFESGSSAGDGSNVYAITDQQTHTKGLLIDAFDVLDIECSRELFERLTSSRQASDDGEERVPSRYGLRKVYKGEFEQSPDRFVLRIGFPDFPECPFGQSFSMLGFDAAEQQYVWLVTSIMKDERLKRIPYQGADVLDNE